MADYDLLHVKAVDAQLRVKPSVITYSRLEPVNLSSGDLSPGLQMLIADPLWMVGRQWQFDELHGEDGGSPILAEVTGEAGPVTRFLAGAAGNDPAGAAVDVPGPDLPVEVAVEAETPVLPERIRAEQGMHLLRLLRASDIPEGVTARLVAACVAAWPFSGEVDDDSDPLGATRRRLANHRIPDGAAIALDIGARSDGAGVVQSLPATVADAADTDGQRDIVREVLATWLRWAGGYVASPIGASWNPHRLEYSFALQATLSTGDVVLRSDEYIGGTVDWHSFDAATGPALGAPSNPVAPVPVKEKALPAPVRYPGMPSDRLWAFEDADVFLGGVKAGSTDIARLALVEFALAYGNDWFLVPVKLSYGDVARVYSVTVTDTFGKTIPVEPSRDVGRPGWTVFQNTAVDDDSPLADVFVLPATLRHPLEGPPLEEVALFRDEMANVVWGVERIVQGPSGEPVKRAGRVLGQPVPDDLDDAAIVYRLMTAVPDHWIPFVSVPVEGVQIQDFATELERRPMARLSAGGVLELLHPHGVLLRGDPTGDIATDRLRIAEEEVPREGVVVTRRFQMARTPDGSSVLWIGRRKAVGQGEGYSGLKFDIAVPPS
ncbi:MAG TPA: hypothetical protein VHT50_15335 [Mycobacterium sp.]|jgi:hypothetical protein|nr:hypothetical protein [Mycobacterium sp.]